MSYRDLSVPFGLGYAALYLSGGSVVDTTKLPEDATDFVLGFVSSTAVVGASTLLGMACLYPISEEAALIGGLALGNLAAYGCLKADRLMNGIARIGNSPNKKVHYSFAPLVGGTAALLSTIGLLLTSDKYIS